MLPGFTRPQIIGNKIAVRVSDSNRTNLAVALQKPEYGGFAGGFAGGTAAASAFTEITFTRPCFAVIHFQMRTVLTDK